MNSSTTYITPIYDPLKNILDHETTTIRQIYTQLRNDHGDFSLKLLKSLDDGPSTLLLRFTQTDEFP